MGTGSGRDEIRSLEILESNRDFRLVQRREIGLADGAAQFGHGKAFRIQLIHVPKRDEAVRLHAEGLVEFGGEIELDLNHVAFSYPVGRTAVPHLVWTRCTVRDSGFRGIRRPLAGACHFRLLLSHGCHRTCLHGETSQHNHRTDQKSFHLLFLATLTPSWARQLCY